MTLPATVRINVTAPFPAQVQGIGGIAVNKQNGSWTISPNFGALALLSPPAVVNPSSKQVWVFDPISGVYNTMTLQGLGSALYKLTSTTSLTIGTGNFTFATQAGKDIDIGEYVFAFSNANPANFMSGQVTAYDSSGNLTIAVVSGGTGGSGVHADWTIRPAGIPGAAGAPGSGTIAGATLNGVGIATGATSMASTAALTDGQLIVGKTGSAPAPQTISGAMTLSNAGVASLASGAFANPTGSVGLTAVNGGASTAMRSDASPALNVAISPTWTGHHTFSPSGGAAITITPPAGLFSPLTVTQTTSGTSAGFLFANQFHVTHGAALTGAASAVQVGDFECSINSTSVQGGVNCLYSVVGLNSPTSPSNVNRNYVAVTGVAQANTGDNGTNTGAGALGGMFGANFVAVAANGATNLLGVVGGEVDVALQTGSSAKRKVGWTVVSLNNDAVHGSSVDAAFAVGAGSGSIGFNDAYLISGGNGQFPLSATATVMRSDAAGSVASGVDLSNLAISGSAFKSANFNVDGSGNITGHFGMFNSSITAQPQSFSLQVIVGDGNTPAIDLDAYTNTTGNNTTTSGQLLFRVANGTGAAPSGLGSGAFLATIGARTYTSAGAFSASNTVRIAFQTLNIQTNTDTSSLITLETTPGGSTTRAVAMTVQASGGVSIGAGAPDPGIGALLATDLYSDNVNFLLRTKATLTNAAAANTATLTNAPVAGNPTKWISFDDNGTTRRIPAW